MARSKYSGILNQPRLELRDNQELERYYEKKYSQGGYEGGGCVRFGINISEIYHRARHDTAIRFLTPRVDEVILDAGCGTGSLSAEIAPRCRRVEAVDIAGNALDERFRAIPNLGFQKMNVEDLTFPSDHFDQVVCVETLEHALHPEKALAAFYRVLKPGGRLVLTYPTINRTTVQRVQRKLGIGRPLEISEHLNEWTYDECRRVAEAAGFRFVRSEGLVFDFGVLGIVKQVSRFFAKNVTALALGVRGFPRNSLFVCVALEKPVAEATAVMGTERRAA